MRAIGGSIAQWLAYLLPDPAPGFDSKLSRIVFEEKVTDDVNQRHCLEESGQWL